MDLIAVRWILRDTEPLGKVGKVCLQDILTVNSNTVESAESDVTRGDIITVRGQLESVAVPQGAKYSELQYKNSGYLFQRMHSFYSTNLLFTADSTIEGSRHPFDTGEAVLYLTQYAYHWATPIL